MLKIFQKHIVKMAKGYHQEMALLSQEEDGLAAINESEIAQRILNADFDPWNLTIREIWQFSKVIQLTYKTAWRFGIEREDKIRNYFCQLYHDIWRHYDDIPWLGYKWDAYADKVEFTINGAELIFGCEEQSALCCIEILESIVSANETFKREVKLRSTKGVMTPSTQIYVVTEQVSASRKMWLYSLIGYDANGQPLPQK